jgi:hypothetical protein
MNRTDLIIILEYSRVYAHGPPRGARRAVSHRGAAHSGVARSVAPTAIINNDKSDCQSSQVGSTVNVPSIYTKFIMWQQRVSVWDLSAISISVRLIMGIWEELYSQADPDILSVCTRRLTTASYPYGGRLICRRTSCFGTMQQTKNLVHTSGRNATS